MFVNSLISLIARSLNHSIAKEINVIEKALSDVPGIFLSKWCQNAFRSSVIQKKIFVQTAANDLYTIY